MISVMGVHTRGKTMSYIRACSEYEYVNAENEGDYVFWSCGSSAEDRGFIQDYGGITDATLVNLFAKILFNQRDYDENDLYYLYLMKKLSDRLNIKLKSEYTNK